MTEENIIYACPFCTKRFKAKSVLIMHLRISHKKKPDKRNNGNFTDTKNHI